MKNNIKKYLLIGGTSVSIAGVSLGVAIPLTIKKDKNIKKAEKNTNLNEEISADNENKQLSILGNQVASIIDGKLIGVSANDNLVKFDFSVSEGSNDKNPINLLMDEQKTDVEVNEMSVLINLETLTVSEIGIKNNRNEEVNLPLGITKDALQGVFSKKIQDVIFRKNSIDREATSTKINSKKRLAEIISRFKPEYVAKNKELGITFIPKEDVISYSKLKKIITGDLPMLSDKEILEVRISDRKNNNSEAEVSLKIKIGSEERKISFKISGFVTQGFSEVRLFSEDDLVNEIIKIAGKNTGSASHYETVLNEKLSTTNNKIRTGNIEIEIVDTNSEEKFGYVEVEWLARSTTDSAAESKVFKTFIGRFQQNSAPLEAFNEFKNWVDPIVENIAFPSVYRKLPSEFIEEISDKNSDLTKIFNKFMQTYFYDVLGFKPSIELQKADDLNGKLEYKVSYKMPGYPSVITKNVVVSGFENIRKRYEKMYEKAIKTTILSQPEDVLVVGMIKPILPEKLSSLADENTLKAAINTLISFEKLSELWQKEVGDAFVLAGVKDQDLAVFNTDTSGKTADEIIKINANNLNGTLKNGVNFNVKFETCNAGEALKWIVNLTKGNFARTMSGLWNIAN